MESIYFEKQEGGLCGQHALNMLLQDDHFTAGDLADIAHKLDTRENEVLGVQHNTSKNMNELGFFSIQVMSEAVRVFDLELINIMHPSQSYIREDPLRAEAFILNRHEHWFVVRRIAHLWFLLNSLHKGPELLSETYVGMFLQQMQLDEHVVYVVTGKLPVCQGEAILTVFGLGEATELRKEAPKDGVITGFGRRLGSIVDDISSMVLGSSSADQETPMEQAIRQSLADADRAGPSVSLDSGDADLQAAIQLSLQEEETPILGSTTPSEMELDNGDSARVSNLRALRAAFLDRHDKK
ncbi:unnamed protein product, partial [Mesorhabditis spiculigera]